MSGYGLWPLVVLDTALFAVFAASFFRPHSKRDWRAMATTWEWRLAISITTDGKTFTS